MPKRNGKKRETLRFSKFKKIYLKTGIASRAMIDAGYSSASAKSNCVDLARKVRVSLEEAARARGIDEAFVLNKLHELSESKTPKWNAETKTWDEFEAGNIQLEAVEKLAEILEPKQVTVKAKLEGADGTPFAIAIINYGVNNSSS